MHRGSRLLFFGVYVLVNLGIILFSIALWFQGKPPEGIFVGLWAPTLDLLYLMAVLTFDPWGRRRPGAATADQAQVRLAQASRPA